VRRSRRYGRRAVGDPVGRRGEALVPRVRAGPELTATRRQAWNQLVAKVERLRAVGYLDETAPEFNDMMEGLANPELRGSVLPLLPETTRKRPGKTPWRR
jgi:hypothetical protein